MDEFDIIDLVYSHVADANTGITIYKNKSKTGEAENHIVINHLEFHEQDWINVLPVNVNIFIKNHSNGMTDISTMRRIKRAVRTELLKIKTENGQYRNSEISGALPLPGLKDGFNCTNIKILVKTDKI
ncbi:MAG: hypothetical protein GX102_04635 [Porphyromonadaceae bacterium]|nr:hypothetical protein [Porphyromonadaceae bacterium]